MREKVETLGSKISESSDSEFPIQCDNAKNELEDLYDFIKDGAILRSKVKWYEQEEKSIEYFLNLEKHNKSKTHIMRLIVPESDSEITEFTDIQKEIKHFYQSLYSRTSTESEKQCLEYLKQINTPKLRDGLQSMSN